MIVSSKPKFRGLDGINLKVRTDKGQLDSVAESKPLSTKLDDCLTWDNIWLTLKKIREATWPTEKNKEISFAKIKNSVL